MGLAAVLLLVASVWLVSQRQRPLEAVYTPDGDAYVSTAHPDTNYGTMPTLRADATPKIRSYLRFRLDDLTGRRVVKAELRLWSRTGDLVGYKVHRAATSSWDELAITLHNGPPMGAPQASSTPFGPDSWGNADVTSLVQSNGDLSLTLTTRSRQNVVFDSREGAHQPQLVVQTKPGRTPAAAAAADSASSPQWLQRTIEMSPARPRPATARLTTGAQRWRPCWVGVSGSA